MARTMMKDGAIAIPKSVRDAYGLEDGVEFDVIDGGKEIRLRPVPEAKSDEAAPRKLTVQEFLAIVRSFPKYEGPPITDEMMHEAINQAAVEDWERLERQWNEDKDD